MDLQKLRYLIAVADHGGFSRAAAVLNVAQPTLSRQLAVLESELGQRLLVRTGRGAEPTDAGRLLLGHARAMLEIADRALDELRDLQASPGGRVVVGLPPRVALGLSAALVHRFRERFPSAVITVLEGLSVSLRESLLAGRMDLALLFDPPPSPLLHLEPLLRESLVLVAPPRSRLPARVALSALPDYPLVLPSAPNAIRALLTRTLEPRGIALAVAAEVGAVGTALTLVARGEGCTVLPESALAAHADGRSLPRAPIGPPAIRNVLMLATPLARAASRLTRETAQMLRELDFRRGA
jgi:LysR family transcriptional regulator, nitrogen assimilation regulatory protein